MDRIDHFGLKQKTVGAARLTAGYCTKAALSRFSGGCGAGTCPHRLDAAMFW